MQLVRLLHQPLALVLVQLVPALNLILCHVKVVKVVVLLVGCEDQLCKVLHVGLGDNGLHDDLRHHDGVEAGLRRLTTLALSMSMVLRIGATFPL